MFGSCKVQQSFGGWGGTGVRRAGYLQDYTQGRGVYAHIILKAL